MATIYSSRLAAGAQSSGTTSTPYTVPSGKVTVIRTITLTPTGVGATQMLVNINGIAVILGVNETGQYVSTVSNLRVVLNSGEEIQTQSLTGAFEYVISGYELES